MIRVPKDFKHFCKVFSTRFAGQRLAYPPDKKLNVQLGQNNWTSGSRRPPSMEKVELGACPRSIPCFLDAGKAKATYLISYPESRWSSAANTTG